MAGAENTLHAVIRACNLSAAAQSPTDHPAQSGHVNMPDAEVSSTMPLSASSLCTSLNYIFSIIWSYISIAHRISHAIIPHFFRWLFPRVGLTYRVKNSVICQKVAQTFFFLVLFFQMHITLVQSAQNSTYWLLVQSSPPVFSLPSSLPLPPSLS